MATKCLERVYVGGASNEGRRMHCHRTTRCSVAILKMIMCFSNAHLMLSVATHLVIG